MRRLREEEIRLWSRVAATVKAAPGKAHPKAPPQRLDPGAGPMILDAQALAPPPPRASARPPQDIEPNRKRHIAREHQPLEARLDLHGLDQDRAEAALASFLRRAQDEGHRAALVITGRGLQGAGILRRRAPEWLSAPALRHIVAGFSEAHRRHGGEGALYVAIKRKRAG